MSVKPSQVMSSGVGQVKSSRERFISVVSVLGLIHPSDRPNVALFVLLGPESVL